LPFNGLDGVISHKTELFIIAAVRTSDFTLQETVCNELTNKATIPTSWLPPLSVRLDAKKSEI
jgi:hypothetical protein